MIFPALLGIVLSRSFLQAFKALVSLWLMALHYYGWWVSLLWLLPIGWIWDKADGLAELCAVLSSSHICPPSPRFFFQGEEGVCFGWWLIYLVATLIGYGFCSGLYWFLVRLLWWLLKLLWSYFYSDWLLFGLFAWWLSLCSALEFLIFGLFIELFRFMIMFVLGWGFYFGVYLAGFCAHIFDFSTVRLVFLVFILRISVVCAGLVIYFWSSRLWILSMLGKITRKWQK